MPCPRSYFLLQEAVWVAGPSRELNSLFVFPSAYVQLLRHLIAQQRLVQSLILNCLLVDLLSDICRLYCQLLEFRFREPPVRDFGLGVLPRERRRLPSWLPCGHALFLDAEQDVEFVCQIGADWPTLGFVRLEVLERDQPRPVQVLVDDVRRPPQLVHLFLRHSVRVFFALLVIASPEYLRVGGAVDLLVPASLSSVFAQQVGKDISYLLLHVKIAVF